MVCFLAACFTKFLASRKCLSVSYLPQNQWPTPSVVPTTASPSINPSVMANFTFFFVIGQFSAAILVPPSLLRCRPSCFVPTSHPPAGVYIPSSSRRPLHRIPSSRRRFSQAQAQATLQAHALLQAHAQAHSNAVAQVHALGQELASASFPGSLLLSSGRDPGCGWSRASQILGGKFNCNCERGGKGACL